MKLHNICLIASALFLLSSCSHSKAVLTYFEDIETTPQLVNTPSRSIIIQDADELFITVNSSHPMATSLYNVPMENPGLSAELLATSQPRQQTFVVDSQGNINFPMLGTIHVAGMSLEQLRDYLTQEIKKDVEDPIVKVSLVNFVVNVAGEVKEPGRIPVSTERFSVLDALTAVGDLTPYAQRDNVLVIREEDGKRTYARLDLNKAEVLDSPYFYLKQNDYIYVEPSKVRKDNADYNQNNSYKLSVVSTIVSGCSVIASLIIALTR